jgi:hypothetical protein
MNGRGNVPKPAPLARLRINRLARLAPPLRRRPVVLRAVSLNAAAARINDVAQQLLVKVRVVERVRVLLFSLSSSARFSLRAVVCAVLLTRRVPQPHACAPSAPRARTLKQPCAVGRERALDLRLHLRLRGCRARERAPGHERARRDGSHLGRPLCERAREVWVVPVGIGQASVGRTIDRSGIGPEGWVKRKEG